MISTEYQGLDPEIFLQPTDDLLYAMYIHELDGVNIYTKTGTVFSNCEMESTDDILVDCDNPSIETPTVDKDESSTSLSASSVYA